MAKYHYLPPQIVPVQTNATTASANIVKAITPDAAYEAKTAQVVLMRENGTSEDEERQLSSDLTEMLGGVAWP